MFKECWQVLRQILALGIVLSLLTSSAFAASYYAGDGHVHTYLSGEVALTTGATIDRWVNVATKKNLNWFSVTDHSDLVLNNKLFKDELTIPEWSILQQETGKNWGTPVLLGEEVTVGNGKDLKTRGHFLTYNINEPIQVFNRSIASTQAKGSTPQYRRTAYEIFPDIRSQKGFGFIAHPYTSILPCDTWQVWSSVTNNLDVVKGMELFSAGKFQGNAALKKWQGFLRQQRPFWVVGNSDTHNVWQRLIPPFMASSYTSIIANNNSESEILNALKNGRAVASNGPSLHFNVSGKYPGDSIKNVAIGSKLKVNVSWSSASAYGNPTRIRIYDQTRDLTGAGTVYPISGLTGSMSLDYEVKGKGYILAKIETDKGKMAYTNPIFIKPSGTQPAFSGSNISVALIIDSSGSMDWNDQNGLRKEAAKYFIDLARPGDRIAVIGFDTSAYTLAGLREIKTNADRQVLKAAVDRIGASGSTNIDAALKVAFNELLKDGSSNKKSAILLTDGSHNVGVYTNPEVLFKNRGWAVFTIGLGTDTNPGLLNSIALQTGGRYFSTYTPGGISEIYFDLSQVLQGGVSISKMSASIQKGQKIEKIVYISSNNLQATFNTRWTGSDVALTLVSPDGAVIDCNTDDPDVSHIKGPTYELYRIDNPMPGDWKIYMEGVDIPQGGEEVKLDVSGIAETPPEVTIGSPQDGQVVRGITSIAAQAKDDKEITDFELYLNGNLVKTADTTSTSMSTINYTWDTLGIPDGYYYFASMAFDSESASGQEGVTLIVDNVMPIADAGEDKKVREGIEVVFDASGSKNVDWFGYYWDFGDGMTETAAGPIISHTYNKKGKYTATLTVTDEAGNTATDTIDIKVLNMPNSPNLQDDGKAPEPPEGLKYNLSDKTIHLVWSPNKEKDLAGYNIYRVDSNGVTKQLNGYPVISVQFKDDINQPGENYSYYVTAIDVAGNESEASNVVTLGIP
ncbi:MAG: CehA/McbA family metallohydrolase [Firmicutes bacterium]|nr:CehA/McbA family metallohydrolase [Bacillota bacterium]